MYKVRNVRTLNGRANSWVGKALMGLEYLLFRTGPSPCAVPAGRVREQATPPGRAPISNWIGSAKPTRCKADRRASPRQRGEARPTRSPWIRPLEQPGNRPSRGTTVRSVIRHALGVAALVQVTVVMPTASGRQSINMPARSPAERLRRGSLGGRTLAGGGPAGEQAGRVASGHDPMRFPEHQYDADAEHDTGLVRSESEDVGGRLCRSRTPSACPA